MMVCVLEDILMTQQNEALVKTPYDPHRNYALFRSKLRPKMDIEDYIDRLATNLHISDSCFMLALIYIDRLTEEHPTIQIDSYSIHRLAALSIILAMKYNDDVILHKNEFVAHVVGIPVHELSFLEFKYMQLIDFHLFVHPTVFKQYSQCLMAASYEGTEQQVLDQAHIKQVLRRNYVSLGLCSCQLPMHTMERPTLGKPEKISKGQKDNRKVKKKASKKCQGIGRRLNVSTMKCRPKILGTTLSEIPL